MTEQLEDLNVIANTPLSSPGAIKAELPMDHETAASVSGSRAAVRAVLDRKDPRLLVVVGPCSIHDTAAAIDYGKRLRELQDKVGDSLLLVMRCYFEKPRTTVGWKGLINDPALDDSFQIERGLRSARELLIDLARMGLPLATEALDPITPQYLQDLIAWSAIGARTTESQTHREMASGLSCAIGFKNGTDGSLDVAINALGSVCHPHRFLGIDGRGQVAVVETRGNAYAHVVLRGGTGGPNYSATHISDCEQALASAGASSNIMVDFSHANSGKDPARQPDVLEEVVNHIEHGNRSIIGVMIESHIGWGSQSLGEDPAQLAYGVSITDGCIDWDTTERTLLDAAARVRDRLSARQQDGEQEAVAAAAGA